MPDRKLRVFLCHSSTDKPIVRELYQRLLTEGWIDPWLDVAKLLPGQHWTSVIRETLDRADSVIIFISNASLDKEGFVQRELNYAWEKSLEKPRSVIYLIPLRLEDCDVPYDLQERHWADYFGDKKGETYDALLQSLRIRFAQQLQREADVRVGEDGKEKNGERAIKVVKEDVRTKNADSSQEQLKTIAQSQLGTLPTSSDSVRLRNNHPVNQATEIFRVMKYLEIMDKSVVDIQDRLILLQTHQDVSSFSEDIEMLIRDNEIDRYSSNLPFYYIFISYCRLLLADIKSVFYYLERAIAYFKMTNDKYNEAVVHGLLSIIYRLENKQDKAKSERNTAIEMLSVLRENSQRMGKYDMGYKVEEFYRDFQRNY